MSAQHIVWLVAHNGECQTFIICTFNPNALVECAREFSLVGRHCVSCHILLYGCVCVCVRALRERVVANGKMGEEMHVPQCVASSGALKKRVATGLGGGRV